MLSLSNAAVELMKANLERHPDKVAYFCGDRVYTYRELDVASRNFAQLLRSMGIAPGERVVIALPDCFAFPAVFLGCLLSGVMAVPAGSFLRDEDFTHIINDSGACLLVSHEDHAAHQASICCGVTQIVCDDNRLLEDSTFSFAFSTPHHASADDFAYLLYSSGSTGRPKGIPHRHMSLLLPCDLVGNTLLGITGDDVIFSTSKLSFCYGLINSLSFPLHFGASAILHPGKPVVSALLDIIKQRTPSIFFSVPTVFRHIALSCAEPKLKLPMRLCCSAGEALPAILFKEWQRLTGLEIIDGIGASEFAYHFICNVPGCAVAGSAGRVVPGHRVRLVDDNGNDVPSGDEGNLLVSGETRSPFYWNLPEESHTTMLPDGFTRTGDLFLERDGYYYYHGRSDDMIKVDAQWVSPVIVEEALASHPAVADCAVAAMTVGALARPGAFVVLSPEVVQTLDLTRELGEHVKSRLPDYMCPARFRFLDALPRTSTGKIKRSCLREHITF